MKKNNKIVIVINKKSLTIEDASEQEVNIAVALVKTLMYDRCATYSSTGAIKVATNNYWGDKKQKQYDTLVKHFYLVTKKTDAILTYLVRNAGIPVKVRDIDKAAYDDSAVWLHTTAKSLIENGYIVKVGHGVYKLIDFDVK